MARNDLRPDRLMQTCSVRQNYHCRRAGIRFLNVQPRLRSQTSSALRPIRTCRSPPRRATISPSAEPSDASIIAKIKASCTSRRELPRRLCLAGTIWLLACVGYPGYRGRNADPEPSRCRASRHLACRGCQNSTAKITTQGSRHHILLPNQPQARHGRGWIGARSGVQP